MAWLVAWLGRQNNFPRESGRIDGADLIEMSVVKPSADLFQGEGIATFRVHQHIDCEQQCWQRTSAVRINEDFRDCDGSSRRKSVEGFFEQTATSLLSFTVQNVPENCDRMPATEIGREQIVGNETVSSCNSLAFRYFPGDRNNARPV